MREAAAAYAFFFDVHDLARAADVTVAPDDAAAGQSGKAEEPYDAHDDLRSRR